MNKIRRQTGFATDKTTPRRALKAILFAVAVLLAASALWPPKAPAAAFYVDPVAGNDEADGSASKPWRTIAKAQSIGKAEDVINLAPADYGHLAFSARTKAGEEGKHIIWRSDPSKSGAARFSKVSFSGAKNSYTTLEGLEIENTDDTACIAIENSSHVTITGCAARGRPGGVGPSYANIVIKISNDVLIHNCEVYYSGRDACGVQMENCDRITVRDCHVHDIVSSGIRAHGGGNYVIEYNVVHDQRADWNPEVHGSGISIRSHDTAIRGNVIYNYGNTRPIRFYQDWAGRDGYRNMLVENNLVYKTPDFTGTQWWPEFIDLGDNCVLRNNTFIGDVVIIIASAADGSGLSLHNNVFTGTLQVEQPHKWPRIRHGRNLFGKLAARGCGWMCFHSDFTPAGGNMTAASFPVGGFFASGPARYPYSAEHPYTLSPKSPAAGFADPNEAPPADLLMRKRGNPADAGCLQLSNQE